MLFTPTTFGPLQIRNRSIRAAAFEGMCQNHLVSDALIKYHQSVAKGGVGMTTVAYAAIQQSGLSFPHQLWLNKDAEEGLRKLTDVVHREGSAASIQLGHCGNMAKKSITKTRPIAPSAKFNLYAPSLPKAMSKNDISETVKAFGEAVIRARNVGFDAVEIHAGHGYLISQFLSPYTNKRKDEFGGSLDNRMRFMARVIG